MPRPCPICSLPTAQRMEVDEALVTGEATYQDLAGAYGVPEMDVRLAKHASYRRIAAQFGSTTSEPRPYPD